MIFCVKKSFLQIVQIEVVFLFFFFISKTMTSRTEVLLNRSD